MAYIPERLATLRNRISADLERWTGKAASKRGDVYYPISQAMAGTAHGLYRKIDHLEAQLFDDSCTDDNLIRRAAEVGVFRIAASRALGSVLLRGSWGAVMPAGQLLTYNGQQYRITEDAELTRGVAIANIRAVEPGAAGNLPADTQLTLNQSVAGVDSTATVQELSGGADIESIERLRNRLKERRLNPPQGGSASDYVAWAKAAHSDVTRAWCYPNEMGPGTVVVRVTTDNLDSPIPSDGVIEAVNNHINQLRPAGMRGFNTDSIIPKRLNIKVTRLSPNTAAVQKAVEAELDDMLRRDAEPGGTLRISRIHEAISLASGETDHAIDLTDDIHCNSNELIVLGTVTWPY